MEHDGFRYAGVFRWDGVLAVRMQHVIDARAAMRRRSLMLTTLALGGLAVYVVYKEANKRDRDSTRRDVAGMRDFGSGSSAVEGISKAAEAGRR